MEKTAIATRVILLKFAFSAFCGIIHIRYQPFLSIGAKNTQNLVLLRVKPEKKVSPVFS